MTLTSGLILADAAIVLACDLEARGHAMTASNGELRVTNGAALTAADRAEIRRYRWHLLAIVGGEEWSEAPSGTSLAFTVNQDAMQTLTSISKATSSKSTMPQSTKSIPSRGKQKKASSAFEWEPEAQP